MIWETLSYVMGIGCAVLGIAILAKRAYESNPEAQEDLKFLLEQLKDEWRNLFK